jgi:hypothetical protein
MILALSLVGAVVVLTALARLVVRRRPATPPPPDLQQLQGLVLGYLRARPAEATTTDLYVYVSQWDKDEGHDLWDRLARAGAALVLAGQLTRTPRETGGYDHVAVPVAALEESGYRRERNLCGAVALCIVVGLGLTVVLIKWHTSRPQAAHTTQRKGL